MIQGVRTRAAAVLAGCLLAAGCGSATAAASGSSATAAASGSSARAAARPAGTASAQAGQEPRGPRKILVIMEENHSIQQVLPAGMPYLWSLARRYGYATDWSDIGHPSLPNYLAIFAGSAFNQPMDCLPGPGCTYPGPTVFGQALALGQTAKSYEESMPQPCDLGISGEYDVNHNPWAYFPSEATSCRSNDVPAGTPTAGPLVADVRSGSLPAVGLITPNLLHDGHDGTLAQADAWLGAWLPVLMSGPDWRDGKLAIAVAFDEGETTEQVPFVLMVPGLSGITMSRAANQYALTRLIDQIIGARPLRQASGAANVEQYFGLG